MKTRILSPIALAIALLLTDAAYGQRDWNFFLGEYSENYNAQGVPNNIWDYERITFDDDFYARLSAALPEGTDIRLTNPGYILNNAAEIEIVEEADVWFTFLHEGAGYRNSIGFYTYDAKTPPQSRADLNDAIIFPNLSYGSNREIVCQNGSSIAVPRTQVDAYVQAGSSVGPCPGDANTRDGMITGDTVYLGRFSAGTNIGFLVAANGFNSSTGVKTNQSEDWIFYTNPAFNAETDPELKAHTVMLYDEPTETVLLGMEDILRTNPGCDQDFNDALFTITSNPPEGIDTVDFLPVPEPVDTDNDGVVDGNDAYPTDPDRAFNIYYPSSDSSATLAFEDRWPEQGDYDMNDLVLRYQIAETQARNGSIRDILISMTFLARGASYHNALVWELTGIPSSAVDTAFVRTGDGDWKTIAVEDGQPLANFVITDDAHRQTPSNSERFSNVEVGLTPVPTTTMELMVTFNRPILANEAGDAPYNPYLYRRNDRGLEIHLPNKPPSALANPAYFGTFDDDSNPNANRYYLTANSLPWALNIPYAWVHPLEQVDIVEAYSGFSSWAQSAGAIQKDWYTDKSATNSLYPYTLD